MKKVILFCSVILASVSQAQVTVPATCVEKISYDIIRYLEKNEPSANVHLVKDENGNVISLTDSEEIYASYDLTSIETTKNNRAKVIFHSGDQIVFAQVSLGTASKPNCRVLSIDSGQDDQD